MKTITVNNHNKIMSIMFIFMILLHAVYSYYISDVMTLIRGIILSVGWYVLARR